MITFRHQGDFSKTKRFLERINKSGGINRRLLEKYGRQGVAALSSATPVDSGLTAASWYYEIIETNNTVTITFNNSNIQNGVPIAVIIQYGHGTGTGGYVQGRDYINPAVRPVFDRMVEEAWREVTKS